MGIRPFLNKKRILITGGSTWVAIDRVRIISNIFSGRTSCLIAKKAKELGAQVTLLLGQGELNLPPRFLEDIKVIRYRYFDELLNLMKREILTKHYNALIHSAAVSDYAPIKKYRGKIPSRKNILILRLKPTIKIIERVKKWDPKIFLVQFKLEIGKKVKELINIAYKSMIKNKSDLVVANDLNKISKNKYEALIIDLEKNVLKVRSRNELVTNLLKIIKDKV